MHRFIFAAAILIAYASYMIWLSEVHHQQRAEIEKIQSFGRELTISANAFCELPEWKESCKDRSRQ